MNTPEIKKHLICNNLSISQDGHLLFANQDTTLLAKQYSTPLYLFDEEKIRENCSTYISAVKEAFGDKGFVLYASKAASFKRIYEIMNEENMGVDVVSCGEIATAFKAGFPLENGFFHSNNKTDDDIKYAIEKGIGYFVVDNEEELYAIDKIAAELETEASVVLRITPGIDPHTYEEVATGKVDSKFGSAIETGQAFDITKTALSLGNITLRGFHCHIGSQVFDSSVYIATVDVMIEFLFNIEKKFGFRAEILDIGGGFGVKYVIDDPDIDIRKNILQVGAHLKSVLNKYNMAMPKIYLEPGRSIIANAGLTLYTVGTLKNIPGYKTYVSVDGGMTDNPRYVLYGSKYTLLSAGKLNERHDMKCSVVGRCCESGDIIQENVYMPSSTKRGDIMACLTTGAYHYSMASNYNRIPRPPVVMLNNHDSYIAVKRESLDDITSLDI